VLAHTVTQGVPRLKELIDMSAHIRTPSLHVNFKEPYASHEHMARLLAAGIEHTYLHEVVQTSEVLEPGAPGDEEILELHGQPRPDSRVIRVVLDRGPMYRRKLTVDDVGRAVQAYLGAPGAVMWSEVNMLQWCVRVQVDRLNLGDTSYSSVCLIHDFLLDNVPVHGVPGINRVIPRSDMIRAPNPSGRLEARRVWSADTEGINLIKVLGLDGVDARTTFSNDIHETLRVLGVEAATHQLLTEIRSVLSHDGAYVNDRHLQLLVDVMTHSGVLSPVTRHSMSKLGASVYTRASFEQTQEVLTWAAAMGTANTTNGVTENIMIGNPISGGTGCCDIITRPDALPAPYEPKVVGKLVRADKTQVVPLNRVAPALVCPLNRVPPGFIGKKRKKIGVVERIKTRRTLVLHSPAPKTNDRELVFHSP
jgi:DNA-directed RNA polymerase II subunit RPB1